MEVRVRQVTYKSKLKWQHKNVKAERKSARNFKITHFAEEFSRRPRVQERALLGLCIYENIPKKFPHLPTKCFLLRSSRKGAARA